jgi:serine-type D-Ala-D-Ala carboxypeptidase/endopeptidase (penicillin-binding protein 4)
MQFRLRAPILLLSLSLCALHAGACAKARPVTPASSGSTTSRPGPADVRPAQPPATPVARLQQELQLAFEDPSVAALWAVEAQSLDTGEVLYQRNAHTLVMPASNMKIVTMAVAAERLGWDFRFTTEVKTEGTVAGGVLTGDLVVVGSGDPTISDRDGANRYRVFEDWADQLRAAGITRIDGRIVGDDNLMDDQPLGEGWMWDDLTSSSAPPGGALQFNENLVRVVITPAATIGQPATVRLDPEGSGLTLRAAVQTIEAPPAPATDTPRRSIAISRRLGGTTLEVAGLIPVGAKDIIRATPVENPTIYFVNALRETLVREGIGITGPAVDIDDLPAGSTPSPAPSLALTSASNGASAQPAAPTSSPMRVLITHRSLPLSEIGTTFMKVSQNLFGETLMTMVGAQSGRAGEFAAPWPTANHHYIEAARKVYEEVLAAWGVPDTQHVIADGSGLSRYNYLTAHLLVRILRHLALDPKHAAAFEATLPIAGKDGTLNRRMKGTRAENNVNAKTGTISNVRSLSGYLRTLDGERIAFSIIANNFKARTPSVDAIAELAVERLANFTRK